MTECYRNHGFPSIRELAKVHGAEFNSTFMPLVPPKILPPFCNDKGGRCEHRLAVGQRGRRSTVTYLTEKVIVDMLVYVEPRH